MAQCAPDIICLQETKTPDEFFPMEDVVNAGYAYTHIHGMKSYNGVATLSLHPLEIVATVRGGEIVFAP